MAQSMHNHRLDLFKGVAIYAVVLAHIPLPGQFGWAVCALAKVSVVLFFLVSGYFSWNCSAAAIGRRTGKTGWLLLVTAAALLAWGCLAAAGEGQTALEYIRGRLDPFFLKEIVLYQLLPLPHAWPLWYLGSQFVVYLIWWAMTWIAQRLGRRLPYDALALLALGLLLVHLSLVEWRVLGGQAAVESKYVRNAWLDGFPFFALGAWMGEHRQAVLKLPPRPMELGAVLCVGLALLEFSRVGVIDVLVGTTLLSLLLMAVALVRPEVNSPLLRGTLCFCGRNLTFYIYVLHVPLYGLMQLLQGRIPLLARLLEHRWLVPPAVAALSTLLAVGLYGLSRLGRGRKQGKAGAP